MTEPVGSRTNQGQALDALLRNVVDAEPGATVSQPPARHEAESVGEVATHHALEHAVILAAEHGLHAMGYATAATAISTTSAILTPLTVLKKVVTEGDARGHAQFEQAQFDRMRGALAVLEGRIGEPEVRAEMARSPAFADGTRRAEALAGTMSHEQLTNAVGMVRRFGNEGQAAVCLGRDHGAAFQRRYDSDAAFAHGVDYARRLETQEPDAFAARRARFAELDAQQAAARQATATRH